MSDALRQGTPGALQPSFAPAAPCRRIEIAGFVLNPVDESCHFGVCTQCLRAGVMSCQLRFREQCMYLPVARAVHEDGRDTPP